MNSNYARLMLNKVADRVQAEAKIAADYLAQMPEMSRSEALRLAAAALDRDAAATR